MDLRGRAFLFSKIPSVANRIFECLIINKVCLKKLLTDDGREKAWALQQVLRKQGQYFSKKAFFNLSGTLRDKK